MKRNILALIVGQLFFVIALSPVQAEVLPNVEEEVNRPAAVMPQAAPTPLVPAASRKTQVKQSTEDCATYENPETCEVWKKGKVHQTKPPVSDMVCWRILQREPQAIVFRIGVIPEGQKIPEGGSKERALFGISLAQNTANLLSTPEEYDEKLIRSVDSTICVGAWRIRGTKTRPHADFVYFCNGERTDVLWWDNDLTKKLAHPDAGTTSYEPIRLIRPE